MIIKACLECEFHEIKEDGKEEASHCRRENCYSRYSKCVAEKALVQFLEQESSRGAALVPTLRERYS